MTTVVDVVMAPETPDPDAWYVPVIPSRPTTRAVSHRYVSTGDPEVWVPVHPPLVVGEHAVPVPRNLLRQEFPNNPPEGFGDTRCINCQAVP